MKTHDDYKDMIIRYLQGKMEGIELEDFEKSISEDDFLQDAVEGYVKMHAYPEDLNTISHKFSHNKKRKKRLYYGIAFSGIAATIIILFLFTMNFEKNKNINTESSDTYLTITDLLNDRENTPDSFYLDDTVNNITEEKQIESFITELRSVVSEPTHISESLTPLYTNKNMIIENTVSKNDLSKYYRFRSNHSYTYLGDFKVVDYRFLARKKSKSIVIPTNKNITDNSEITNNENISYMAFLEQTLEKIENKHYYEAIDDLNIILENYPDDENAVFYKGLCYFEVNKNKQSMRCFETTLNSQINTFHEEAKWYKGLILKKEKQYEIAEKVLEEIVNENGYYGVQAKKELEEIYKYYMDE
jgi:TolA-binding protein